MRHRVVKKTLGRNKDQRKALIANLSGQLISLGKINTTLAKAKVIKPHVEKLVTKAIRANKTGDKVTIFNAVKLTRKHVRSDDAIRKLFEDVAPKFIDRPGGYLRIVKTGNRGGDNALLARIEFVETVIKEKEKKEKPKEKTVKEEKAKPVKKKEEKKDEKNTK
jgi:large subunit ribosomal protein L17